MFSKQALLLIIGAGIPLLNEIMNLILSYNGVFRSKIYSPLLYPVSLLFFWLAILKFDFLNIIPIALQNVVNSISDSFIILDKNLVIADYNETTVHALKNYYHIQRGIRIEDFLQSNSELSSYKDRILQLIQSCLSKRKRVSDEFHFIYEEHENYFIFEMTPIYSKGKRHIGTVILIKDMTEHEKNLQLIDEQKAELEEMNAELINMNEELISMNDQLKEHLLTVEELAIAKERNRFARDIHDTLGHTLTTIIKLLQVTIISNNEGTEDVEGQINKAIEMAREGLKEVRRSISGLLPEKLEAGSLESAIKKLISVFNETSGVEVHFLTKGLDRDLGVKVSDVVFRTCQEGITNAIRHGKATTVLVNLVLQGEVINLVISDNGVGCTEIKKGFGLTGMEERVRSVGGSLDFSSDEDSGFSIRVKINLDEKFRRI